MEDERGKPGEILTREKKEVRREVQEKRKENSTNDFFKAISHAIAI